MDSPQQFQRARRRLQASFDDYLKIANLLASGDLAASEVLLREVLVSEPQNATAHYQLARLLSNMGEKEQAAQHYRQFEKLKKP